MNDKKKFSETDCKENDPQSRVTAVQLLTSVDKNFHLVTPLSEQKEAYKKWDFVIHYGNKPFPVETERKRVWTRTDGTFPYDTIDVPTRKDESKALLYVMFNESFTVAAMTEMVNVLNADIITKATKRSTGEYITQNEKFFHVPVNQFQFYIQSGTEEWSRV